MNCPAADELQDALRPITSLIIKSEKAQQKMTSERWQYRMLQNNLNALRHACALMNQDKNTADYFTREDSRESLNALASMISKTEKAQEKFSPGTSQHTLLRNRLNALRLAEALIKKEYDKD